MHGCIGAEAQLVNVTAIFSFFMPAGFIAEYIKAMQQEILFGLNKEQPVIWSFALVSVTVPNVAMPLNWPVTITFPALSAVIP